MREWYWENFSEKDLDKLSLEEVREFLESVKDLEYEDLTAGEKRLAGICRRKYNAWVLSEAVRHKDMSTLEQILIADFKAAFEGAAEAGIEPGDEREARLFAPLAVKWSKLVDQEWFEAKLNQWIDQNPRQE
jgi:hypothetical protein